jgi:hypothetical protein
MNNIVLTPQINTQEIQQPQEMISPQLNQNLPLNQDPLDKSK